MRVIIEIKAQTRFEPNAYYEQLLDLRRTNPKAFAVISPVSKLALFEYEKQKRLSEEMKQP
jgi:hypothetical protein